MRRWVHAALLAALVLTASKLPALAAAPPEADEAEPVVPALLVIDIQNAYLPRMDQSETDGALRVINGAIWLFRQYGRPVIRVHHTDPQWGPGVESEEFRFPESVNVTEDDPQVVKSHPCAFVDTELDALLEDLGVNTVFLCGLSATGCVLATYFGALERDYGVFMIEDALMSPKARHTEAVTEILDSVSGRAMETVLKAAAE
ncbi:MAG: cysteine hydrolase [Candidatus Krumholzibacteriota bacterium]|nr:cysteine hydrolase [Candidatus Krumholzibacteriota bacterium]